ncbi:MULTISPECIES: hypothetical protein [Burkholderia]|uniref:hypothetical protein n=1 Tax=Burkholderia TaxID=32008 RepID=UPI000863AD8F|nr:MULTISPECIES: hypothetical protein [Burkholderia]AOL04203.1 hypothetical protein WI95_09930 [Burkholderia contaminans]TCW70042.1 hypothetical protein C5O79_11800 [Burkholderia sp. SRS-25]
MSDASSPTGSTIALRDKVAALRTLSVWPDSAKSVEAVETHMSWVFLTDRYAWKLKKPVRAPQLDFRTLAARHRFCCEEVRLNQRLAPGVYLDTVPLAVDALGCLHVGGTGEIIDWLVRMRRLPNERMLDRVLSDGNATPGDACRIAARLSAFYRTLAPVRIGGVGYRAALRCTIDANERALRKPFAGQPVDVVHSLCARQRSFLMGDTTRFDLRVRQGRVVEGHGDLRPEHVCIDDPIAIIDCLEFCRRLRVQDAADEVGFLALECERLGAPGFAGSLVDAYRSASGDDVDDGCVHFYQSYRAMTRARLAVWHLREPEFRTTPVWRDRASAYLALARRHIDGCERAWVASHISDAAGQ